MGDWIEGKNNSCTFAGFIVRFGRYIIVLRKRTWILEETFSFINVASLGVDTWMILNELLIISVFLLIL